MTVSCKHLLDGDVSLARRALQARSVRFAVDQLHLMDEVQGRILGPEAAPSSPSSAMGGDTRDEELTTYPGERDGGDWDFPDVPIDPHFNFCASLRQHFDAICKLCGSANMTVPEDATGVYSLAWQSLNVITEGDSSAATKPDALKCVRVVDETAAASWAGWTLEKIDMFGGRDKTSHTMNRLYTDLMGLCGQFFVHAAVQSERPDAQHASPWFEASWKATGGHAKASEGHLGQVAEHLTVAQA